MGQTFSAQFVDLPYDLCGQAGGVVALSKRVRAVHFLVGVVVDRQLPAKIAQPRVGAVTIKVGDFMPWRRRRPNERQRHKPVHWRILLATRVTKMRLDVAFIVDGCLQHTRLPAFGSTS
jgi:hypothetical protein